MVKSDAARHYIFSSLLWEKHKNSTGFFLFTTISSPLKATITNMLFLCSVFLVQKLTYFSCWGGGLQTKLILQSIIRIYKQMKQPIYEVFILLTYVEGYITFTIEMRQEVTFKYRELSEHSSTHIREQKKSHFLRLFALKRDISCVTLSRLSEWIMTFSLVLYLRFY
jgi:hypothetical protein